LGTLTINASTGATFHRSLVIFDGAHEIGFLSTDPGIGYFWQSQTTVFQPEYTLKTLTLIGMSLA
jgi:hypothetical protein